MARAKTSVKSAGETAKTARHKLPTVVETEGPLQKPPDVGFQYVADIKKRRFLQAKAFGWADGYAAAWAGVCDRTPYNWRKTDGDFAKSWHEADERATQYLEQVAYERATRPSKPSDLLLIFLLKARRPDIYRDKYEHRFDFSGGMIEALAKYKRLPAKERERVLVAIKEAEAVGISSGSKRKPN